MSEYDAGYFSGRESRDDEVRQLELKVERLRKDLAAAPRALIMGAGEVHTLKFDTSELGSVELTEGRVMVRQPWWLCARIKNGDAVNVLLGQPLRWFINGVEQFEPPPQAESISDA